MDLDRAIEIFEDRLESDIIILADAKGEYSHFDKFVLERHEADIFVLEILKKIKLESEGN